MRCFSGGVVPLHSCFTGEISDTMHTDNINETRRQFWKLGFLAMSVLFLVLIVIQLHDPQNKGNSQAWTPLGVNEPRSIASPNVPAATFIPTNPGRIQAIATSQSGKTSVMIDTRLVEAGETVNGCKIHLILEGKIIYEYQDEFWIQTLYPTASATSARKESLVERIPEFTTHKLPTRHVNLQSPNYYRSTFKPSIEENGSYYGQISQNTGRPKTVHVKGYYRKNGTYVRGHYRSRPR